MINRVQAGLPLTICKQVWSYRVAAPPPCTSLSPLGQHWRKPFLRRPLQYEGQVPELGSWASAPALPPRSCSSPGPRVAGGLGHLCRELLSASSPRLRNSSACLLLFCFFFCKGMLLISSGESESHPEAGLPKAKLRSLAIREGDLCAASVTPASRQEWHTAPLPSGSSLPDQGSTGCLPALVSRVLSCPLSLPAA